MKENLVFGLESLFQEPGAGEQGLEEPFQPQRWMSSSGDTALGGTGQPPEPGLNVVTSKAESDFQLSLWCQEREGLMMSRKTE